MPDYPPNWSVQETTPIGAEPVATSDVKHYARIDTTADDVLVAALTSAARRMVQQEQHRQLIQQTLVLWADGWPNSASLQMPRPPLSSVTSVQYVAANTADSTSLTTMPSSDYLVDANQTPGRISLRPTGSWPDIAAVPNAIKVTYVAGTTSIPDPTALAIKMLATHLYEHRTPVGGADARVEIPYGLQALIHAGRWGSLH